MALYKVNPYKQRETWELNRIFTVSEHPVLGLKSSPCSPSYTPPHYGSPNSSKEIFTVH